MMNDDQEIWPADFFDKTLSHTHTHTHMYAWILPWLGGYQLSTNDVWSGSGCLFTSYSGGGLVHASQSQKWADKQPRQKPKPKQKKPSPFNLKSLTYPKLLIG